MNQISRKLGKPIVLISRGAIFDYDVLAFNKIGFLQTPTQSRKARRRLLARSNPEISDHRHGRLLRASGERPRCRHAAEQRNEFAPLHVLPSAESHTLPHRWQDVGRPAALRVTAKSQAMSGSGSAITETHAPQQKTIHAASAWAIPAMTSAISLSPFVRGDPAMWGVRTTFSNDSSSSSDRPGSS